MTGAGGLIVNVAEFEVPPPGPGFTTVTDAVPTAATLAAGTIAVSLIEETNVVVKGDPFQLTFEVETKLVPFTVRVNWALPAMVAFGLIELIVGIGLLIVKVSVALPVPPALVALMVTLYVPAVVGVPEISPVVVFTANPAGSPVAVRELVMTGVAGLIVKVNVALPVPPALVALMVTLDVPAVVGVPEIRPVVVFTANPAGSPVALKLVGLLVAVI
jgi:hypothetical protein